MKKYKPQKRKERARIARQVLAFVLLVFSACVMLVIQTKKSRHEKQKEVTQTLKPQQPAAQPATPQAAVGLYH